MHGFSNSEDAAQNIRPGVGHHAGAQALAPERERAEERAEDDDLRAGLDALVAVGNSEQDGLQNQGDPFGVRVGFELFLEIAAKDEFFADAGADGDADP